MKDFLKAIVVMVIIALGAGLQFLILLFAFLNGIANGHGGGGPSTEDIIVWVLLLSSPFLWWGVIVLGRKATQ